MNTNFLATFSHTSDKIESDDWEEIIEKIKLQIENDKPIESQIEIKNKNGEVLELFEYKFQRWSSLL